MSADDEAEEFELTISDDSEAELIQGGSAKDGSDAGGASLFTKLLSCLVYMACSISLNFVTKSLFGVYEFKAHCFVFCTQLVVSLVITSLMMAVPQLSPTAMPKFDMQLVKESAPQSILFTMMVLVSFVAIASTNIPLFLCLRRTTTLFVLVAEYFVLHKTVDRNTLITVLVMTAGAMLAGVDGLLTEGTEASGSAYFFVFANNGCQALYLNFTKKFQNKNEIKSFGLVFYQSLVSLPIAIVGMVALGELSALQEFTFWTDPGFIIWLTLSGCLGVVYTYAVFWCNSANSPVVVTVTGAIKDTVTTFTSIIVFGGFVASTATVAGLVLSFLGSLGYSLNKVLGKK